MNHLRSRACCESHRAGADICGSPRDSALLFMRTTYLPALAACAFLAFADTNKVSIPTPAPELDAKPVSQMPTNAPIALQSGTLSTTDTNAIVRLPFVQQFLAQAFQEGAQFGIAAALQNKTLAQMDDAQGLLRAAMFMRFGAQKGPK